MPRQPTRSRGSHDFPQHPSPTGDPHRRRRAVLRADRRARRRDQQAAVGPGPGRRPRGRHPHAASPGTPDRRQVPQHRQGGTGRPAPGGLSGAGQGHRRLRPPPGPRVPVVRGALDHRGAEAAPAGPDRPGQAAAVRPGGTTRDQARTAGARTAVSRTPAHADADRPCLWSAGGSRRRGPALPWRAASPLARRTTGPDGQFRGRPQRSDGGVPRRSRGRCRTSGSHPGPDAVPGPGTAHPRPALLPRPHPAADRGGRGCLADACVTAARPMPGPTAADARGSGPLRHRGGTTTIEGRCGPCGARVRHPRHPALRPAPTDSTGAPARAHARSTKRAQEGRRLFA